MFLAQPAASQAGTELQLGFWNIRDFSDKNRSESELQQIAQVAHGMDCMAICELNDTVVLGKLVNALASLGGTMGLDSNKK